MTRREQLRAAALSFAHTLGACVATAWATLGFHDPFALTTADLQALGKATVAALAVLAFNWLRAGETRYGRGAEVPTGTSVPVPGGGHVRVLATCPYCGDVGPAGEDHSCPCPNSDADCTDHQVLVDELPPAPSEGD